MKGMTKAQVEAINRTAQQDFTKAQAMLEAVNLVLGTKYGWLNKRVVFFDEPDESTCIKYRNAHDAWAYAQEI